jgi:predicted dienelactone hydrolase
MRFSSLRLRSLIAGLTLLLGQAVLPTPAQAIEEVVISIPLLESDFVVRVDELRNPDTLWIGTSDLAQLNQATDGSLARQMVTLFNDPLPLGRQRVTTELLGNALAEQVLLMLSSLIRVDGLPTRLSDQQLLTAVQQSAKQGPTSLRSFLEAIPGQRARIRIDEAFLRIQRLLRQQRQGQELVANPRGTAPAPGPAPILSPGNDPVGRSQVDLVVKHRSEPLQVVVLRPQAGANGQLVVISHGLWDSPENFEGWANHLASHGYTVILPRHPGSDQLQQQAMLAGQAPPPSAEELRARPLDVIASLDAVAAGRIPGLQKVNTDRVTVIGHSWGATTALQLGGARPSDVLLRQRCKDLNDPDRNLSWILQCSFLQSADQASLADPRVKSVIAVSPVVSLLFAPTRDKGNLNARTLVVSGTNDWVAPSGPEAIMPFRAHDNPTQRLVLVDKGDHFNLRRTAKEGAGPLRALLLAWVSQNQLPATRWQDDELVLVDVSPQVLSMPAAGSSPTPGTKASP